MENKHKESSVIGSIDIYTLFRSDNIHDRKRVADNIYSPLIMLSMLAKDENILVREAALSNPKYKKSLTKSSVNVTQQERNELLSMDFTDTQAKKMKSVKFFVFIFIVLFLILYFLLIKFNYISSSL